MSQLVDVFLIHEDLNLVFEFCETDLESILMEQSVILKPEHVKCHMQMLLEGINYLHINFVLHRVRRSVLGFRKVARQGNERNFS